MYNSHINILQQQESSCAVSSSSSLSNKQQEWSLFKSHEYSKKKRFFFPFFSSRKSHSLSIKQTYTFQQTKSKAEIERLTDYLKYVENNFYSKWKYLSNDTITTGSLQVPSGQYLLAICITAHVSYIISCHSIETQYI